MATVVTPFHNAANAPAQKLRTPSTSSREVQLAFASAIAVLLVTAGLSYRSSVQAEESDWWVRHTHEVIETLQDLALSVRTIESSVRGFEITGDDAYLAGYRSDILRVDHDQELFATLTVD